MNMSLNMRQRQTREAAANNTISRHTVCAVEQVEQTDKSAQAELL